MSHLEIDLSVFAPEVSLYAVQKDDETVRVYSLWSDSNVTRSVKHRLLCVVEADSEEQLRRAIENNREFILELFGLLDFPWSAGPVSPESVGLHIADNLQYLKEEGLV